MRLWIITVGEPLPSGAGNTRLLRSGLLAGMAAERGHEVVWWTSTFDHSRKAHRSPRDERTRTAGGVEIIQLHGPAYRRNVSLRRIAHHVAVARRFRLQASRQPPPEVILCSLPTLELCVEATRYGRARAVPVVIDARDMWPDLIAHRTPRLLRPLAKLALLPMYRQAREACRGAAALTGITREYVEWALRLAGRRRGPWDREFPLAYPSERPAPGELETARAAWWAMGVEREEGVFLACLFSSMVRQFDLETVIGAARLLEGGAARFRFVLCGTGESLEYFRGLAAGVRSVLFPGWVGRPEIWSLMQMADVGLLPYRSTPDFEISIPNKAIEYMAGGLPLASSLRGVMESMIDERGIGFSYRNSEPEGLAEGLRRLRNDPERRQGMAVRSRALFEERFAAEKVYSELIDHLTALAGARPG